MLPLQILEGSASLILMEKSEVRVFLKCIIETVQLVAVHWY